MAARPCELLSSNNQSSHAVTRESSSLTQENSFASVALLVWSPRRMFTELQTTSFTFTSPFHQRHMTCDLTLHVQCSNEEINSTSVLKVMMPCRNVSLRYNLLNTRQGYLATPHSHQ
jgi:hypothetical protein